MRRIIFFMAGLILSVNIIYAQNVIKGKITDEKNNLLPGVNIYLPDLNKGTVSNLDGEYQLTNLPDGELKILFSYLGYSDKIETIVLDGKSVELDVILKETPVKLEEIVVSGGFSSTQHENTVKIDKLNLKEINLNTPNVSELLSEVPGVDMISKGSGVSKPVIRGLSKNDILVLNNGFRYENYQYSDHHPLGLDEFGVEDIEIIKGPASLLYGSDAIGGVINFINEKPAPVGKIIGDYNFRYYTNTLGFTNNLGIKGSSEKFSGGIRFGYKTHSDFKQGGGDFVPNSRFNEKSLKLNLGYTDKIGSFKLYYDYGNQKLGLVEDEAIEEIKERGRKNEIFYQEFDTHMISSRNKLFLGGLNLDVNLAYQNTSLNHIAERVSEIEMELGTFSYEMKMNFPLGRSNQLSFGFQGYNQKNKNINDRETILLPDANSDNYSVFALLKQSISEKLKFQTGLRYDRKDISTEKVGNAGENEFRPAIDKKYDSFSGSFGLTYALSDELHFRTNFASGYRTPNLAELTSNGPHELRFELGDENLKAEKSYELDAGIHLHKENMTLDIACFYNRVNDYIFISKTGLETNDGLSIYKYNQADSYLYGGEAGLHFHPESLSWLHLKSTFSYVIGKKKSGEYLPFIPAHKLGLEFKIEREKIFILKDAYLSLNADYSFKQTKVDMEETTTDDYLLVDLGLGGIIKLSGFPIFVDFSIKNIFDKKYIDHLSTLKETEMFNPGRNIGVSLKIPFNLN